MRIFEIRITANGRDLPIMYSTEEEAEKIRLWLYDQGFEAKNSSFEFTKDKFKITFSREWATSVENFKNIIDVLGDCWWNKEDEDE